MNLGQGCRERTKPKHNVRRVLAAENAAFFAKISSIQPKLAGMKPSKSKPASINRSKYCPESKPNNIPERVDKHFKLAKLSCTKKDIRSREKKPGVVRHDKPTSSATLCLLEPPLVERRKLNIKTKLLSLLDPIFTQIEEQEINQRADAYARTTPPDSIYYILPENVDSQPLTQQPVAGKGKNGTENYKERQKRKRRSYNNIDCFVTHTRKDDVFGSRHCLPAGTKLVKPQKKLVKLVAEAVDKSPDGLLQVQQIYAVLQNKFPYFRYMDKLAISSWRSSIRHALYQKWFRKIRFSTEAISSKGCFWAINQFLNPNEWIVPCNPEAVSLSRSSRQRSSTPFLDMLQDPNVEEEEHLKDVIQIAKEYGISFPECVAEAKGEFQALERLNVPSPVRDPDPILVACVPDYSVRTPQAKHGQFDVDEGFEELPFILTPVKLTPVNISQRSTSPGNDSVLTWTSLSLEELPNLFSPSYTIHPYGMPVFPDNQNSQN